MHAAPPAIVGGPAQRPGRRRRGKSCSMPGGGKGCKWPRVPPWRPCRCARRGPPGPPMPASIAPGSAPHRRPRPALRRLCTPCQIPVHGISMADGMDGYPARAAVYIVHHPVGKPVDVNGAHAIQVAFKLVPAPRVAAQLVQFRLYCAAQPRVHPLACPAVFPAALIRHIDFVVFAFLGAHSTILPALISALLFAIESIRPLSASISAVSTAPREAARPPAAAAARAALGRPAPTLGCPLFTAGAAAVYIKNHSQACAAPCKSAAGACCAEA